VVNFPPYRFEFSKLYVRAGAQVASAAVDFFQFIAQCTLVRRGSASASSVRMYATKQEK
jgi:hypothetical protein